MSTYSQLTTFLSVCQKTRKSLYYSSILTFLLYITSITFYYYSNKKNSLQNKFFFSLFHTKHSYFFSYIKIKSVIIPVHFIFQALWQTQPRCMKMCKLFTQGNKLASLPVLAVFLISATNFFSCNCSPLSKN
jgi:hypothetical protein